VRFLKEVKQQTRAKSQLKHLLVLASRILAISFLVLAFAQPYIPVEENQKMVKENVISIYIDNSFSMDAVNSEGRLLEQAKIVAQKIATGFKPTDRYQLLTNNFEGRQQRLLNQNEFLEQVDNISMSSHVRSVADVIRRQDEVFQGGVADGKRSFIVSDFQESNTDFQQVSADTNVFYTLVPIASQDRANLYIDSCWFESPIRRANQPDKLLVRIQNISDKGYDNIPLKLMINGTQKALGSCKVGGNSYVDVPLSFTINEPGMVNAVVSLTDYPVTFDDSFYFNYEIASSVKVLCISDSGSGEKLRSLYTSDPYFLFNQVTYQNVDYSTIPEMHVIILENLEAVSSGLASALKLFRDAGGSLAVFPGMIANLESYQLFLGGELKVGHLGRLDTSKVNVDNLNLDHFIFSDVFEKVPQRIDLPVVNAHYEITNTKTTSVERLFSLENGETFLDVYDEGRGTVYLFSVPLLEQASNLPEHALFVPLMYKIAIHSLNFGNLFYTLGQNNQIEGPVSSGSEDGEFVYHLMGADSKAPDVDIIPETRVVGQTVQILLHNMLSEPGNYQLMANSTIKKGYAFNYNRTESNLRCYSIEELEMKVEKASLSNFFILSSGRTENSANLSTIGDGTKLWKLCIIFALVFLAIETLLLRFLK